MSWILSAAASAALVCALAAPAAASAQAAQAVSADALRGRNLAATCANCHGSDGRARGDMKPLAGLPAERTVAMMAAFRDGSLPATIMHQVAKGYTDEQTRRIAAYFAAQRGAP